MNAEKQAFFEANAQLAMEEQIRYGIPASVTLIQMWTESGGGRSKLANGANNYFGVKGYDWERQGRAVMYADDDKKHEPFRKYGSKEESVRDHSLVLMGKNYKTCHGLDPTDYKGWLDGLHKAGYATDPNYSKSLVADLERYDLQKYDKKAVELAKAREVRCGYMRGATLPETPSKRAAISTSAHFGMPIREGDRLVMTSDYGLRNISYGSRDHKGIDLRAGIGTPVYATEDGGIVIGKDSQPRRSNGKAGGGNFVYVAYPRPDGTYRVTGYLHLDTINVKIGDKVNADTVIAKSGNTGGVAPHLDFRVAEVKGQEAVALKKAIDEQCLRDGQPVSTALFRGKNNANMIDPKIYLAEVAVQGNLDTRLVTSKNTRVNVLASYRDKVSVSPGDKAVLADNGTGASKEADRKATYDRTYGKSIEDKINDRVKSNGFLAALSGNGDFNIDQMFQGGDFSSSLMQLLLMSFISLAFNKTGKDDTQTVEQHPELSVSKKEYDVRENLQGVDIDALKETASMNFDILSPGNDSGQQVNQQEKSGVSLS